MISHYRGSAVWLLLGAACSAPPSFIGPPGVDAGADSSPSVETACTDLASAECAELDSCSSVLLQMRYGSPTICRDRLVTSCSNALAAPATGNSASKVEACARAYPTWFCSDYLGNVNLPAACAQPTGALPSGASCAFAAQCTTGFCAIAPNAACGTCAPAPRAGDSCADLSTCGQRLICLSPSRVCGTFGASGVSCSKEAPCGAHLSCVGADSARGTLGTCQQSSSLTGAVCDPTLVKGPGCDFDSSLTCNGESKRCEPLTVSAEGGPCDSENHQFATCAMSGRCSTSEAGALGSCTAAAGDGKACSTQANGPGCVPPARCIVPAAGSTSGTCQDDDSTGCK